MARERVLTAAEIRRKTNKPIMEKKRRQRINKSLEELKEIVVASSDEGTRSNKLEKADILEMTVLYLQSLNKERNQSKNNDLPLKVVKKEAKPTAGSDCLLQVREEPTSHFNAIAKRKGYAQCVQDTISFVQSNGLSLSMQNHLFEHLSKQYNTFSMNEEFVEKSSKMNTFSSRRSRVYSISPYPHILLPVLQNDVKHQKFPSDLPLNYSNSLCLEKFNSHQTYEELNSECEGFKFENTVVNDCGKNQTLNTFAHRFWPYLLGNGLREQRLCSSSDSGNWSSGSRATSPEEIYFEGPERLPQLPEKDSAIQGARGALWRPWEQ